MLAVGITPVRLEIVPSDRADSFLSWIPRPPPGRLLCLSERVYRSDGCLAGSEPGLGRRSGKYFPLELPGVTSFRYKNREIQVILDGRRLCGTDCHHFPTPGRTRGRGWSRAYPSNAQTLELQGFIELSSGLAGICGGVDFQSSDPQRKGKRPAPLRRS